MNVKELYKGFDIEIKSINTNSYVKRQDSLFVCIKGKKYDGHDFVQEAILNGAIFIVSEKKLNIDIPYVIVNDSKDELARITSIFYGNPSCKMKLTGITGTDGKTTIASILNQCIDNSGYIGTNGIKYSIYNYNISNTTPNPLIINSFLDDMLKNGIYDCFLEVSSEAILDKRINYIPFQIAIFTNLTHEHLNSHENMENYFLTKAKLFENLDFNDLAIINIDNEYGLRLTKMCKAKIITYSLHNKATLMAKNIKYDIKGSTFDLVYKYRIYKNIKTNLIGEYNISNLLAVILVLFDYHIPFKDIRKKLENIGKINGRMEIINSHKFTSIIDFAHTPNALNNLLLTVKKLCKGNIILVMGACGNKDKTKRPLMGEIASSLADFVIFTEEDNHDEAFELIIDDLTKNINRQNYIVINSRKKAIMEATRIANYNDFIVITGKGNEKTMSKENIVIPYNDIDEIRKYI